MTPITILRCRPASLLCAVAGAAFAPAAVAQQVLAERDGTRLVLSGRFAPAVVHADDGDRDKVFLADNDNSGSRFGLLAETARGDWTAGAELVIGVEVNSTDGISFDDDAQASERFGEGDIGEVRQANVFFEHPRYGHLSLGQGDEAGEDASEADVSGTDLIAQSDVDDIAGGLAVDLPAPDGADGQDDTEARRIDAFFDNLDAERSMRLLYETPERAGFALRASVTQSDELEPGLALVYTGEPRGVEVEAALAWRAPDGGDEDPGDVVHGSVSAALSNGLSLTLTAATFSRDDAADDPDALYVKLGYATERLSSAGETAFSIDLFSGRSNDAFAAPDGTLPTARSVGGGVVQSIDALNVKLYLGARTYEVRDAFVEGERVADPDPLVAVFTGAQVRF